jgi:two-component system, cell cycle sensor histidine kinase and response regulator CckA
MEKTQDGGRSSSRFVLGASDPPFDAIAKEIHLLEKELEALTTSLRRSAANSSTPGVTDTQIRLFADAAPVMIWTSGRNKLCVYVNKAWLEFTGKSIDQEVGTPWTEGVHPDDLAKCESIYTSSFEERKAFKTEYRLRRWDGEYRWIIDHGAPWYLPDGTFAGFIGSCFDISERIQLENQLRQSQKMEALGQLAAGVAHDFNNILTIIQGHSNLLLSHSLMNEDTRIHVKEVSDAAERASHLTRQLLMFSRRQIVMQPNPVDLNEVVTGMAHLLQRLLGDQVTIEYELQPRLPTIQADTGMLEQVILNLVVNARDAMPRGGQLKLSTEHVMVDRRYAIRNAEARVGNFLSLSVRDNGSGMDAATLMHIFEPFFTTKGVGKGTGLGLSTVYGIVKMHHGWVEVQSRSGIGSEFKVFLPLSDSELSTRTPEIKEQPPSRGGSETILVVEDEPGLRSLLRQVLEVYGYHVIEAPDADSALKVWAENRDRVHLLLTDMMMPGTLSGKELWDRLAQEKPGLKAIITSGYNAEACIYPSHEFYLQKPYQPEDLLQLVRKCLDS